MSERPYPWNSEDSGHDAPERSDQENLSPGEIAIDNLWKPIDAACLVAPPRRREWLLTLPNGQGGHGVLPRGKVGLLASEGGVGKTSVLVALAVSVLTGRPWLGHYPVPATVTGRVLLLLGEEDHDDVHRRLWKIAEALKLTDAERTLLAAHLIVIPLAGIPVGLTTISGAGLAETPLAQALRDRLVRGAGENGWALVGLDPLSRFAGGDVEGSNEAATRFVELLESLAAVPGHPTVLVSSHSSKVARRQGQADVRGVTGLSDAARWVGTMRREGEEVIFAVAKSNYSLPAPPLRLHWHEETLAAVSGAEILDAAATARNAQNAEIDEDVRRVVEVLTQNGPMTSRDSIATTARMKLTRGRAALDLAIARGLVTTSGTDRHRTFTAVPEVCCTRPPHTPPRPGRTDGLASIRPDSERDGLGRTGTAGRTEEGEAS